MYEYVILWEKRRTVGTGGGRVSTWVSQIGFPNKHASITLVSTEEKRGTWDARELADR